MTAQEQQEDWPQIDLTMRNQLVRMARVGTLDGFLDELSDSEIAYMLGSWEFAARLDQLPPASGQGGGPWSTWAVIGGRGAGKTRTGAEWVRGLALGLPGFALAPTARIALIGETLNDVRDVMIEGVSGLLSIHAGDEMPRWEPSRKKLTWPNGAIAQAFSAEDPNSLRGPQFEAAWCDELAKWRKAEETWDMLQFGLRLGSHPRQIITTTPRPIPLLKRLLRDPTTCITRAPTSANAANLSDRFMQKVLAAYGGTRLGRQELQGEMIEDVAGALWTRQMLEDARADKPGNLVKIVVAVDPPASSGKRADACGIVAAGIDASGMIHVLADASLSQARPAQWAQAAAALYHRLEADVLVAEVNQGGEMVERVLREVDAGLPVKMVRATRGKYLRAAPVAQLYEQGRVRHCSPFPALEDELCSFCPDGLPNGRSPDRMDALVWAITALALTGNGAEPRVRQI